MFYGLKESNVDIPSGKLNYVAFGNGQKHLIIIQGLNVRDLKGAGFSLALMYRSFAKDYRVYFFDRRTNVIEGLTNWELAEDIYCAMKVLNINSADVIGVSQGGMIAMALTLEHPECVNKLVLGVTSSRANENIKKVVSKWVNCANKNDHITINKDTFSMMYTEKYLRKYKLFMPFIIRMIKPKDFNRFAILASAILDFNCYDRLNEIKCPVLVLGGAKDMITTGDASIEIAKKLGCEIHMYSEYGHAAYEEAKDFNQRIYDFLIKKDEPLFIFDEGNDVYVAKLNGITFQCETLLDEYHKYAQSLANKYESKLNEIIEFILPDIKIMFEIEDVDIIRKSLGKPLIDLDRCVLSYLEHTFDPIHIIDVEFSGIFDQLLYSSIDG